jgi:Holliday junction resolvase-like predicted endonuclease
LYIRTKTLVFVEVKLRRGSGFEDPLEAVTPHKQHTLRSVAEQMCTLPTSMVQLAHFAPEFSRLVCQHAAGKGF